MVDTDGPLDFESEDPLLTSVVSTKRRRKVIGLDDLLIDFYKEKGKLVEQDSKRAKARKIYNSDEDDDETKETLFTQYVDKCQRQMGEISGEEEFSRWGMLLFGNQKPPPALIFPEIRSCMLLLSFMDNEINTLVELNTDNGKSFLEGLLINGWLSKLVFVRGCVEKSIATWTFNLLLYSPQEDLRMSACDFWCTILSSKNEVDPPLVKIEWFPSYPELKGALEIYGFNFDFSSSVEILHADSDRGGPPQNIRAWIKFASACCQVRGTHTFFLTSEAEELVGVIICLFLDCQLQGLLALLHECMLSVISYFADKEWNNSCKAIAKFLARRVPRDLNCLRTVECISGVNTRSMQLRSTVAYEMLVHCFDEKITEAEEIMRLLIAINVKEKSCDLFKVYIYIVLAENWLSSNSMFEEKPVMSEMWCVYLRNCSCLITSTDLRFYASKVRNKASYLLQGKIST